ncbi:hypothetical protein [Aestuariibaculum sediminum]|uniref:Uncharacterized protein n=1 Tax=Aestuariibaculum sediminum TaxID=2770637 RepID=A0A8J6PZ19_9FLAO|nr:hypothetical protein [Aestuariibaculum sediminum]MBD0831503.1 hypothetical protein [Aestuariibaculum sediminum]
MSEHDKYDVIFNEGTFIDYKIEAVIRYALYAVDMFFVEIEYNRMDNKVVGLRSFKTGELLDKYSKRRL